MMLKSFFFVSVFAAVALTQVLDVHFWEDETCDGVGAALYGLEQDTCCTTTPDALNSPPEVEGVDLFNGISTDTWRDIADGTEVLATAFFNDDPCGIQCGMLEENTCLGREDNVLVSGAFFMNGQWNPTPSRVKREPRKCSSTRSIDSYIMKKEGVIYSVSASNATHVAAIRAAESSAKRGEYIMANHEAKKPASILKRAAKIDK